MYFHSAVSEQPGLGRDIELLRRRLEADDYASAREAVAGLERALPDAGLSPLALKAAQRGVNEVGDALGPDAYWRAKTWKRVAVIFAGPGANLVLAVLLFAGLFMVSGGVTRVVADVSPKTPAAKAGLQPGDEIINIDGRAVDAKEIAQQIRTSGGKPITLVVKRGRETVMLEPVRPKKQEGAYRLGFALKGEGLGPLDSTWQAVRVTGIVSKQIGISITQIVTGDGRDQISSPVGIVQGSSQAADRGLEDYLWVLGLISLSLALLNLLPLLPLDGGHIAFSVIEGIRGKAVAREVYERVSAVGIAVVLLLFFIGLSNDIGRLGN
jgi:regulator of sigma E protease